MCVSKVRKKPLCISLFFVNIVSSYVDACIICPEGTSHVLHCVELLCCALGKRVSGGYDRLSLTETECGAESVFAFGLVVSCKHSNES